MRAVRGRKRRAEGRRKVGGTTGDPRAGGRLPGSGDARVAVGREPRGRHRPAEQADRTTVCDPVGRDREIAPQPPTIVPGGLGPSAAVMVPALVMSKTRMATRFSRQMAKAAASITP